MEADGGFVEDVKGADEAGAERGCELYSLRFAAGEGGTEAVEGEVFEADLMRKWMRWRTSSRILPAISVCDGESCKLSKKAWAAVMVRAEISQMFGY